ncbi:MAG: MBL fold metallo-hydrolase [Candidatus Heimdallarchaeota archaeon]
MKIQKIGDSGVVFSLIDELSYPDYYCPANVYALNGDEHIFLSDGYVLFNSHWHWDHLRGNNFFDDTTIISHQLTKKLIIKNNKDKSLAIEKYQQRKIVLPNLTFTNEFSDYEKENVLFFHSPGHTEDSSSCYDSKNKVLFAGDNVEYPFPYVRDSNSKSWVCCR